MGRKGELDVDLDRGSGSVRAKRAESMAPELTQERDRERSGFRELDAMVEASRGPGLTRLAKDSQRITPRETNQPLGRPVMQPQLPAGDEVRSPVNGYQRKVRSRVRRRVDETLPAAQFMARTRLVNDPKVWTRVNDALSDTAGDVQALAPKDEAQARRVDRAIQAYEAQNTRGHVVYFNVELPKNINHTNAEAYLRRRIHSGDQVTFDRYTAGTHQMHETAAAKPDPHGRVVIVELQTRRGAYMGGSDSVDHTEHLLPRAMAAQVVDIREVHYTDRAGGTGKRLTIRMRDASTQNDQGGTDD